MELFEQKYRPGMDADAAIMLALEGLRQSLDDTTNLAQVEVLTIDRKRGARRLLAEEIQKYAAGLPSAGGKSGRS